MSNLEDYKDELDGLYEQIPDKWRDLVDRIIVLELKIKEVKNANS